MAVADRAEYTLEFLWAGTFVDQRRPTRVLVERQQTWHAGEHRRAWERAYLHDGDASLWRADADAWACLVCSDRCVGFRLLLYLAPARANDESGQFAAKGNGTLSCGAFMSARKQRSDGPFLTWFAGFITATNVRVSGTYDIAGSTDMDGLLAWLDNWCRANPTKGFSVAAENLVHFLYPHRTRKGPPQ